jgi:G3E family GTPase
VQRFLTTPEGRGTAVIINEFGAVGIDDALVRGTADEVALLGNGCLCCTTRSDLQLTLRRLVTEREHGQVPPFARIVIETSGLADPGPVLATFATDRALGGEFFVEVVAAVVDAVGGLGTLEWSAEARKQVILADRIVVSKTDLADRSAVECLIERLAALNPRGLIEAGEPRERSGFIAEAEHSDGILSFVLTETAPLSWEVFSRALETLIALRGSDLLRAKGFLDIEGCRGPVLVQVVQHLAHPPIELAAWPEGGRASRLVFISRNIPECEVRALFDAVRALAAGATTQDT